MDARYNAREVQRGRGGRRGRGRGMREEVFKERRREERRVDIRRRGAADGRFSTRGRGREEGLHMPVEIKPMEARYNVSEVQRGRGRGRGTRKEVIRERRVDIRRRGATDGRFNTRGRGREEGLHMPVEIKPMDPRYRNATEVQRGTGDGRGSGRGRGRGTREEALRERRVDIRRRGGADGRFSTRGRGREEWRRGATARGGGGCRRGRGQREQIGEQGHQQYGKNTPLYLPASEYTKNRVNLLAMDKIKELAQPTTSASDMVKFIAENEAAFLSAFGSVKSYRHNDILHFLIVLLQKLLASEDEGVTCRILGQVFGDESYGEFCSEIESFLKKMGSETKPDAIEKNIPSLTHLVDIGIFGIERIPHTMLSSFPKGGVSNAIDELEESEVDLSYLTQRLTELKEGFKLARKERGSIELGNSVDGKNDAANPPKHFTDLPTLPCNDDLTRKPTYLQANIVKGAYQGWDHYLDIQFRLLREDFIAPLRDGIQAYREEGLNHKFSQIRVYEQVQILAPVCLITGIGFQISFNSQQLQHIKWEQSKWLIFGSLLCLSRDGFCDSFIFASVVKRNPKELKMGRLIVKLESDINEIEIDPDHEYVMVESTAYFEAYRHILLALQNASRVQDAMPFKYCLVECDKNKLIPPLYIRSNIDAIFDFSRAFKHHCKFAVTDDISWADLNHIKLFDSSQLAAIKKALTQELSLIQGPPGTGKTYVGLKIMEILLQNRQIWDPQKCSPILVVCYTNHALDQFLEGINNECPDADIVRIGGRCKSETLSNCILAEKAKGLRGTLPKHLYATRKKSIDAVFGIKLNWEHDQVVQDPNDHNILPLLVLQESDVISPQHTHQLLHSRPTKPGKEIQVWLNHEVEESDSSDSEDEFIYIDEEPKILQEQRIVEGEDLDFPEYHHQNSSKHIERKRKHDEMNSAPNSLNTRRQQRQTMAKVFNYNPMPKSKAQNIEDVWQLNEKQRWELYHRWLLMYIRTQKQHLEGNEDYYNDKCAGYIAAKQDIDCCVAMKADVVGMTTTGAAKYHHILKAMKSKIVIVEEAAEVFESHIITSLTPSVQQLILIGDHKQLRPKPNHYELEKKYNFGISLFERLIMNGIPHVTLGIQHRMRPDIADLIRPAIYPVLADAQKVKEYECVQGVRHNLFFINHESPEKSSRDKDSWSHSNTFEAKYLVKFCCYLLKQGYDPAEITVLTMYRGQLLEMKKLMKRKDYEGIRVTVVDDYQGEENDIILLSLVRSNLDGRIGFLSIENRICVSLSRAKKGLYVIGNFSMLQAQRNTKWPAILKVLKKKKCIGPGLELCCQIHPKKIVVAQIPEDFSKCPEGGCHLQCNARLKCGHKCTRLCHPLDRSHEIFKCKRECKKKLHCGHQCPGKCYLCANGCTSLCTVPVDKYLPCGHIMNVPCYQNAQDIKCTEKCKEMLLCDHLCQGTCGSCHQGRLHIRCQSECGRNIVCGHICNFPCSAECPPCQKLCKNYCTHSECPKDCYEPCDPCMEDCDWKCEHLQCTRKCGEICDRPPCNRPCFKRLPCGHPCIGLCGEKCPKLCRICNPQEVADIFFGTEDEPDARFIQLEDCGHVLEYSGMDEWMKQSGDDPNEIQLKGCPKCKTLIRRSLRYANEVKKVHNDFEMIKRKQTKLKRVKLMDIVTDAMEKVKGYNTLQLELDSIKAKVCSKRKKLMPHHLDTIRNQLNLLPIVAKLYTVLAEVSCEQCNFGSCDVRTVEVYKQIQHLQYFLMDPVLSKQQLHDIDCEVKRLDDLTRLCDVQFKLNESGAEMSCDDKDMLDYIGETVYHDGIAGINTLSEVHPDYIDEMIEYLNKTYEVEGLTHPERADIVKAVGLTKGHWFKCPNGHIYCIGECGGAMVEAKCPECGATIGGRNHRLTDDNQLAPEMDGAQHAAWSEQANMENYDLRQFQL